VTPKGRPYLEPHHTRHLSDGGPDHPEWVVAVCPTCHKRAHYASDWKEYNAQLKATANPLTPPN
jgi:5-methylcytosine-specific restriction protein A